MQKQLKFRNKNIAYFGLADIEKWILKNVLQSYYFSCSKGEKKFEKPGTKIGWVKRRFGPQYSHSFHVYFKRCGCHLIGVGYF